MTHDLFVTPTLAFEKTSAETTLPEDPNVWPNEILQELFKQVNYISDFEPHIIMDRVDAERGTAFGHVEVMNKTEATRGSNPQELEAAGVRQVRIPIIVKNRKLQPFDVLVTDDAQMLPLTEGRLRQAVFRPQAFDVTSQTPGDVSLIGQLYPPYRQGGFTGGATALAGGLGKMGAAAKEASILSSILPTISGKDQDDFLDKLDSPNVWRAYEANAENTAGALGAICSHTPSDDVKIAGAMYGKLPADTVGIYKDHEGYRVKRANHSFWAPFEEMWDRGQVVDAFGGKVALAADTHGEVVLAEGAEVEADMPEADTPAVIQEFGVYKVQDDKGRHLIGYVFPNLLDIDGKAIPICLFTNGSQAAVQGEIVGVNIGGGASLFEGRPHGAGAFYEVLPNGRAQCTVPMTIQGTLTDQGEERLSGETFDGRPVDVLVQPNIQRVTMGAGEGRMLVPSSMRWLPLEKAESVVLASSPESFQKAAQAKHPFFTINIRGGGGDTFSLEGIPLSKLAYDQTQFLHFGDALFLLAGLGVSPSYASQKLAQAYTGHAPVEVRVGRVLTPASEELAAAEKTAEALEELVYALRADLVKEAALIPDPTAVDTLLSLGFINPENLRTFIGYLPKLDEVQRKLCELLVAARVGLRELPISALEKAIRSTEEVIEGLHVLAFGLE